MILKKRNMIELGVDKVYNMCNLSIDLHGNLLHAHVCAKRTRNYGEHQKVHEACLTANLLSSHT